MEKLLVLLEYSSLLGVTILINCKQRAVKLVWLISIVLLLALSFYFISEIAASFYLNQEVTRTETIRKDNSEFLAVSICIPTKDKVNLSYILFLNETQIIDCKFDEMHVRHQLQH